MSGLIHRYAPGGFGHQRDEKADHNGVVNFSVLDGWWIEGHIKGYTAGPLARVLQRPRLVEGSDDLGI